MQVVFEKVGYGMIEQLMQWAPSIGAAIMAALTAFFFRNETKRLKLAEVKKAEASASKDEIEVKRVEWEILREQLDRADERLKNRDEKVDSIYIELRAEQAKSLDYIQQINELRLQLKSLELRKCDKRGCGDRTPPSEEMA